MPSSMLSTAASVAPSHKPDLILNQPTPRPNLKQTDPPIHQPVVDPPMPAPQRPAAYIIQDPDFKAGSGVVQYHTNQIITLTIQKYHFDELAHRFDAITPTPVLAELLVQHYFDRQDDNYDLPYQLDGVFTSSSEIPLAQRTDPVFSALSSNFRFTFRFDPMQGVGCLVHFGTDIAAYERSPMCLLWRSALCRDHNCVTDKIIRLANKQVAQIFHVIPSER